MTNAIASAIYRGHAKDLASRVACACALLIAGNIATWLWALIAFHDRPVLLGMALLAYSFGLRHAFDADHIVAIDNVTRKLMQDGRQPVAVGFFFSLGHSTVVFALTAMVSIASGLLAERYGLFTDIGGVIGTSVSTLFLFAIALANGLVLLKVYAALQKVKRGGRFVEESVAPLLAQRGFLSRLLRPLFHLIGRSWHMYPLGILFGLGFDTATEIGLLAVAASQAAQGLPFWTIMMFPTLFTAGMVLMDTVNGIVMLGVYGWASVKSIRKLYYNLAVTLASVMAAVAVGGIQGLGLIGDLLGRAGDFWDALGAMANNVGSLGYVIVAFFIAGWITMLLIERAKGRDGRGTALLEELK